MRARMLVGVTIVLAAGCSSQKLAPVSGVVTLNGKPLAGASVGFEPVARKEGSIEAPLSSGGKTDANGAFTLKTVAGGKGALVGKHKVMISLHRQQVGESDARPPRGGWPQADVVPARYNTASDLTFDVPSGGTDKPNFDLKSP